jgi:hypothetical protein
LETAQVQLQDMVGSSEEEEDESSEKEELLVPPFAHFLHCGIPRADGESECLASIRPRTREPRELLQKATIDSIPGFATSELLDFMAMDLDREEEKDRLDDIAKAANAKREKKKM